MTILEDQTHRSHSPVSRELHIQMNEALSEAKRLRRRIGPLLAAARGSSERANEIMLVRENPRASTGAVLMAGAGGNSHDATWRSSLFKQLI
jgi:hypothetical protein